MWYSSLVTLMTCAILIIMSNSMKDALEDIKQNAFNAEVSRLQVQRMTENAEGRINTLSAIIVSMCEDKPELDGCDRAKYLIE